MSGKFLIVATVFVCICIENRAQSTELGVLSSPKSVGIEALFSSSVGNKSLLRLYTDLTGVIEGDNKRPGYAADWHILLPIHQWTTSYGGTLSMYGGPGIAAGGILDPKDGDCLTGGLSGIVRLECTFRLPITIGIGYSAILACKIYKSRDNDVTLSLYTNGLKRIWMPEISIKYRF